MDEFLGRMKRGDTTRFVLRTSWSHSTDSRTEVWVTSFHDSLVASSRESKRELERR